MWPGFVNCSGPDDGPQSRASALRVQSMPFSSCKRYHDKTPATGILSAMEIFRQPRPDHPCQCRTVFCDVSACKIVTTAEAVSPTSAAAVAFTVMIGFDGSLSGAVYIPFCDTVPQADSAQPWPTTLQLIENFVWSVTPFTIGTNRTEEPAGT